MSIIPGGNKLQECCCERDLGADMTPFLSPEQHMRGIVRKASYILASVKVALKYMDSEMFRNI